MSKLRVGLIGYGVGGSVFHAPFIRTTPDLELHTIVTSRSVPFDDVRVVPNVDAVLSDPGIDLVVLTTPTHTHFELANRLLEAGKHLVVDKPLVPTTAEADALIALAQSRGLLLSVYQNRRWDGDFLTLRRLIAENTLGKIAHFESHYDRFRLNLRGVWREQPLDGSGILHDLGSHLIDQALVLFGRPRAVWADVRLQREGAQAVDYFHLQLDYGYLRALLHASMIVPQPGARFTLHGERGSFFKHGMDPQEDALKAGTTPDDPEWGIDPAIGELYDADGRGRDLELERGNYGAFYAAIADAVRNGTPLPVDPRDSRDGLVIIEAALRSAAERRVVDLVF